MGAAGQAAGSAPRSSAHEAAVVVCGRGGVDVTVALGYDAVSIGPIAATYFDLAFEPPLQLPQTAERLRPRLTSLLPQGAKVGPPTLKGNRLRIPMTTAEQGVQPANAFTMRFDCPAGSRVPPSSLSCTTTEVVGASGQPLDDALAHEVRCVVVEVDPVRR
jgi:hypothetical protein